MAEAEVVAGGAELGDRFVAVLGRPDGAGWRPAADLFGAALDAVLDEVAPVRGTDSPAVAGSLLVEQYASRLAAPVIAAYVRDAAVLDARLARVRVQLVDGVVRRLAFDRPPCPGAAVPGERRAPRSTGPGEPLPHAGTVAAAGSPHVGPGDVAASLRAGFEPVADAVHRRTRVGLRTLRGAMANAVANAFLHLSWPCADRAHHVPDARGVLAAAGWADLVRVQDVDGWMYTDRNTCCLAFRTSANRERERHYCLTCPITPRSTTLTSFREATASYARRPPR